MKFITCGYFWTTLLLFSLNSVAKPVIKLEMDCMNEIPFSTQLWCQRAKVEMIKWYPRFKNLMGKRYRTIQDVKVVFEENGYPGMVVGNEIFFSREWAYEHEDDIGLAIHELIHIMQDYIGYKPSWLVEGIADYYRWAIFEGRSLSDFPIGDQDKGYLKSYQYTAGFLYWLESLIHPGIVKKLDSKLSFGEYNDNLFDKLTGKSLEQLWTEYYLTRTNQKISSLRKLQEL